MAPPVASNALARSWLRGQGGFARRRRLENRHGRPGREPIQAQLILKQEQGVWSGQLVVTEHGLTLPLEDIKVQGAALSLKIPTDNGSFALEGQVSADKLVATRGSRRSQHKLSGTRQ